MKNELTVVVESSGLPLTKGQQYLEMFTPHFQKMADIESKINMLDTESPALEDATMARAIRIALKNNRVASDKVKKEMKKNILIEGKLIDSLNNIIVNTERFQ